MPSSHSICTPTPFYTLSPRSSPYFPSSPHSTTSPHATASPHFLASSHPTVSPHEHHTALPHLTASPHLTPQLHLTPQQHLTIQPHLIPCLTPYVHLTLQSHLALHRYLMITPYSHLAVHPPHTPYLIQQTHHTGHLYTTDLDHMHTTHIYRSTTNQHVTLKLVSKEIDIIGTNHKTVNSMVWWTNHTINCFNFSFACNMHLLSSLLSQHCN